MSNIGSQIPVFRGTWSDQIYLRGDLVLRSGVLYQALTDTSAQPDALTATPGKGNPASWVNVTALVLDFTGSADPTAGAGIPSAIGSTYRYAGTGLYVKTGAGATAWTDVTTVSDDDPGAVGANALWVQTDTEGGNYPTLQMWIRNAADDGWIAVGAGSSYDDGTGDPKIVGNWDFATGRMIAGVRVESTNVVMSSWSPVSDVTKVRTAEIGQPGFRITSTVDGNLAAFWLLGTAAPTAGGGVAADVGSLYSRTNGSAGELWVKTGAGDTAWSKVAP